MKAAIRASLSTIAATMMLVACASKDASNPSLLTGTSPDSQRLIDNANKQILCRRQRVTVSRIDSVVCLTRAEWKEQREHANEVMHDVQESAAGRQPTPSQAPPPPSNAQ